MANPMPGLMKPFEEVCAGELYRVARETAEAGRPVAGYACSYAPQELLHAAGCLPVRLLSRPGATPKSDALLQTFACSFARSLFDSALSGELDFLRLCVFAHTCDTMQSLADLWRRHRPDMPTLILSTPAQVQGDHAREYFGRELDRFRAELEAVAGAIPDGVLMDSVRLYAAHQSMMRRLYALRRAHPTLLTGREMMAVVLSSFLMLREDHLKHLTRLVEAVEPQEHATAAHLPRVVVAGSVCQNKDFVAAIEEAGCIVVDDDLCTGWRSYMLPDISGLEPMDALRESYLGRLPCPAFHRPGFDPGAHVLKKVQAAKADGVIFLLTKFCDPAAFDYPPEKRALEEAGVPALLLEVEQNVPAPEQFRTRGQAFAEMLAAKAAQ